MHGQVSSRPAGQPPCSSAVRGGTPEEGGAQLADPPHAKQRLPLSLTQTLPARCSFLSLALTDLLREATPYACAARASPSVTYWT
jgi:hypothetical protein